MVPGLDHREQILGGAAQIVPLPCTHQIVLERREADRRPEFLAVEGLAHCPARIDARECAQRLDRPCNEATVPIARIALENGADTLEKHLVVRARARRRANGADALHTLGKDCAPVQCLLAAHRPAISERQLRDAEALAQQPLLRVHIVPVREHRIAPGAERLREIARRGREPVAELIGNDDEIAFGIENAIPPDQPVDVGVMRRVGCRVENDIRLVRRELAISLVREMGLRQRHPALQRQRSKLECLMVCHV